MTPKASPDFIDRAFRRGDLLGPTRQSRRSLRAFEAIEVHGCEFIDGDGVEQCDNADAEFWSVYGRYDPALSDDRGITCLADFRTREEAETYAAKLRELLTLPSGTF